MDQRYKIQFLPEADSDLRVIDDYLSQFSESAPTKFFRELDRILDILKSMPYAFNEYPERTSYRRAFVFEYLLFYKVFEEAETIQIHAVWHGSMDIRKQIITLP
jgi:plasmid stabilization system protein ParE